MGTVLDVGIYEFPEKAKAIKVKILFNVHTPIRAGMFIGNDKDGITWVDFRYENLSVFCFGCGLIRHHIESCQNQQLPFEGGTNPRGAWLRTRNFGKRIYERPEKTFCSNPLRSMSGGPFSPIPKGLLDKFGAMNLNKQDGKSAGQHSSRNSPSQPSTHAYKPQLRTDQGLLATQMEPILTTLTHQPDILTTPKHYKRKLDCNVTETPTKDTKQTEEAGLGRKASQLT